MSIIRKIPWTVQPPESFPIDFSDGLVFAGFFKHNQFIGFDRKGRSVPTVNDGDTGVNGYHVGPNDVLAFDRPPGFTYQNGSIAFDFTSDDTTGPLSIGNFFRTGTSAQIVIRRQSADTDLSFVLGADVVTFSFGTDIWDQKPHRIVARWRIQSGNDLREIAVDGEWKTSTTSTTVSDDSEDIRIFNSAGFNREVSGTLTYFALFQPVLSRNRLEDISENPYKLFQPRTQYIPIEVAAAGGATPKYPLGLPLYGPFRGPIG